MGVWIAFFVVIFLSQSVVCLAAYFLLRRWLPTKTLGVVAFVLAVLVGTYIGQRTLINTFIRDQVEFAERERGKAMSEGERQLLAAATLHAPGVKASSYIQGASLAAPSALLIGLILWRRARRVEQNSN